ncbi:MAG: YndJ family transporter [Planctomycetes bacterium]|nr:YndJ family transporter [Planctomycetota bacterium]
MTALGGGPGDEPIDALALEDGGALLEVRPRGWPPLAAEGGRLFYGVLVGATLWLAIAGLAMAARATRWGGDVQVHLGWDEVTLRVERPLTGESPTLLIYPGPGASLPNPLFDGRVPVLAVALVFLGAVELVRVTRWRARRVVLTRARLLAQEGVLARRTRWVAAGEWAVVLEQSGGVDVLSTGGVIRLPRLTPDDARRVADVLGAMHMPPADDAPDLTPGPARRRAVLGGVAALLAAGAIWPSIPAAALLLAALVLVPLALGLLRGPEDPIHDPAARMRSLAWRAWPWAAGALVVSLALWPGPAAAVCALPWLGLCGVVALGGALRLRARGLAPSHELAVDAACLLLAVGGAWTVISRAGLRPLGFDDTIVALTAVHFHHAGLALPLLLGLAGRARGAAPRPLVALILGGVPAVALGIVASRLIEWWASWLLAAGAAGLVWLQVREALDARAPRTARLLLLLSGLSLGAGMLLAALYGLARAFTLPWPSLELMLATHGPLNAVGFALLGLVARALAPPGLSGVGAGTKPPPAAGPQGP